MQQFQKLFGIPPSHACIVLTITRAVVKIAPPVDDPFGRTAGDSKLQAPAGDEIRGAGILRLSCGINSASALTMQEGVSARSRLGRSA
jgi:hypothetical protein